MKIAPINTYNYNVRPEKTAFCSVKKNNHHKQESENPSPRIHPALIKAYMLPKALLNDDIRSECVNALTRSNEVLDEYCKVKAKSYKITEESKEILEKSQRLYKLVEKGDWEDVPFFEDQNGDIGYVDISGDTVDVRFNARFTEDVIKSDEMYSFKKGKLECHYQDLENFSNGCISCKTCTAFEDGKLAAWLNNLTVRSGCQEIDEEFNFDDDGYVSRCNKNFSKSANGIITYDEIFVMWKLGVLESYIKGFRQSGENTPSAYEQMDFSGASLTRYIKNNHFSQNETLLEFDRGLLTKIIKDGVIIPPPRRDYEN